MTEVKVGTRVRGLPGSFFPGQEGVVVGLADYPQLLRVLLDSDFVGEWVFINTLDLEVIEEPAKPDAKPECYVTAWCCDDGGFSLINEIHITKAEADAAARYMAQSDAAGAQVAVFKMVSKHSSAVTVTSEDV